jgi:hypothetical protein
MSELSPCAVCGGDVSSNYKWPGPCGRGINYYCGKRIGGLSDEPRKNSTRRCSSSSCSTQARPEEVSDYINRSGGHDSRLGWWTVHANRSISLTEVARPLLSVRITGSMTVERVTKPLKNKIMTEERANLSSDEGATFLRVGLNLHFLQHLRRSCGTAMMNGHHKSRKREKFNRKAECLITKVARSLRFTFFLHLIVFLLSS